MNFPRHFLKHLLNCSQLGICFTDETEAHTMTISPQLAFRVAILKCSHRGCHESVTTQKHNGSVLHGSKPRRWIDRILDLLMKMF